MEIICPICNQGMVLFTRNKDLQKNGDQNIYSAYECNKCNILFQYPFWKQEETYPFYETTYYAHTDNSIISRSLRILDFYLRDSFYSKLFSPFLKKKLYPFYDDIVQAKTVLDIGCGKGSFLDVMKKHNKKTYGLEPSDQASAIAFSKGHTMITKEFFYSANKEVKFDLITMFQVAEHLSVQEIFDENIFSVMYDSLAEGGRLVIETPNYECNYAKKYKSNWRALEMPRHLVIFSPSSLSKILNMQGFATHVFTRVSPIDVRESFKLQFRENTIKNRLNKFITLLKIAINQKNNSSLVTVIARKNSE
ncbi:class I SAM-dependent methyltransferase [Ferruginibacter paludis]|uniref:class I SAM-dependent methyltransferase n=1 Tax=Ferruginibacter paludis TaxID=1310417 RepID=UPI0025B38415|nr:class I SAM-dependent methyltransferase [Ferruginibacter paludis]MDN3658094.1 class I SAM-dependent methyltransferase [Ferruginibacter paludis]